MLRTAIVVFSLAAIACAQDSKSAETRKLSSVTWDLDNRKLIWVVQKGTQHEGTFVASKEDRYEITPDDAVMSYLQEKRGFTEDEATSLHHLLDVLSLYCAESTAWWDDGQGIPLDPNGKPSGPGKHPEQPEKSVKPRKVDGPQRKTPAPRVREGELVATVQ
jgi:hypothetical protein